MSLLRLEPRQSGGGTVQEEGEGRWRLAIPAGPDKVYRWAQIDDYMRLPRGKFPWQPPLRLELRARVSAGGLRGTWGFGLWNDPFSMSFGLGGMSRRIPALPNAAWFFHASPPSYLSFRSDIPAQGFLAATFRSARVPSLLLGFGAPALPLLLWPPSARWVRRFIPRLVHQDAALVQVDPTDWHTYRIDWKPDQVSFCVDGNSAFATPISPTGPLALVLWIDNQYAAFTPQGRISMGSLSTPVESWLEMDKVDITPIPERH